MSSCDQDATFFPYDTCSCQTSLQSNGYPLQFLNISLNDTTVKLDMKDHTGNWFFVKNTQMGYLSNTMLNDSSSKVSSILYKLIFSFHRKSNLTLMAYVVPGMMTSLLMVLTFIIPVAVSERVTSSLIVYLTYTLIAIGTLHNIPKGSTDPPILGNIHSLILKSIY